VLKLCLKMKVTNSHHMFTALRFLATITALGFSFRVNAGIRVSRLTVYADRLFCKAFVIVLSSLSCVLLGCIVLAH